MHEASAWGGAFAAEKAYLIFTVNYWPYKCYSLTLTGKACRFNREAVSVVYHSASSASRGISSVCQPTVLFESGTFSVSHLAFCPGHLQFHILALLDSHQLCDFFWTLNSATE